MEDREAREMVWLWYKEGATAMQQGWRYEPPDNIMLRTAYSRGWEDEINGKLTTPEEAMSLIFGCDPH